MFGLSMCNGTAVHEPLGRNPCYILAVTVIKIWTGISQFISGQRM